MDRLFSSGVWESKTKKHRVGLADQWLPFSSRARSLTLDQTSITGWKLFFLLRHSLREIHTIDQLPTAREKEISGPSPLNGLKYRISAVPFRANLRLIEFQDSLSHHHHSMKGFSLKPNRIRRRLASPSKQHLAGVFFTQRRRNPVTAHHQHTKQGKKRV
jgi:hypothetical protein